jgi:NAD(P) transhydrogenase subunit beta
MITDRMLKMFKRRKPPKRQVQPVGESTAATPEAPARAGVAELVKRFTPKNEKVATLVSTMSYVAVGVLFVWLLRWAASASTNKVATTFTTLSYLVGGALFILALKWMSDPKTARNGVLIGQLGMLLAVVGTLVKADVVDFQWILVALFLGSAIGIPMAVFMPMTAMPQRIALSHAFGALAAALVGTSEFYLHTPHLSKFTMTALGLEVLLGFLTFTGSLMAFGKLQGLLPDRPITYRGQNLVNLSILVAAIGIAVYLIAQPGTTVLFPVMAVLALGFGIMLIVPIGGADMPTVISLLNSYAGLSGAAMGFVLNNKVLIIAGALDGSSGFLLSIIMCRAMNRSFTNVLFGAFGKVQESAAAAVEERTARSAAPDEAVTLLDAARSVIIVPGYGMAVAQAQHKVRELGDLLGRLGIEVKYAIHPVAGRMPGHMNVLLAEANVSYDQLFDMDQVNDDFDHCDVALVIGANDVVNPAARHDTSSPIYGMPILNVDHAQTVMVIKRSMRPGFAGIENELFYDPKTLMVFGDAKAVVSQLVDELSKLSVAA